MPFRHRLGNKIFEKIHHNALIYNTCWEDPRCDREVLALDSNSRVVMLTSAGCNALDYLLDDPAAIHCVDVNPRQNALLHFKAALFGTGTHYDLFDFFGVGAHAHATGFYRDCLRNALPENFSRRFWDGSVGDFFSEKGLRKSFYWRGGSGTVAWAVRQWLRAQPGTERLLRRLFESETLAEQCIWYEKIEPRLMSGFFSWFVQQHVVQSMLGVPKSQQAVAGRAYSDGLAGYIRACMRRVFTEIPLYDNYFWQLYFFGRYLPATCPNYLRAEHFNTLRERMGRIGTHTMTLSHFLEKHPGKYTHFVLLDHQDWMAAHDRPALEEEWRLIFQNAAPGAKILLRSAAPDHSFLPTWAEERLVFDVAAVEKSVRQDRVGTYASTHFAAVR